MEHAWNVLRAHGLPEGPIRPVPSAPPNVDALRAALGALVPGVEALDDRRRDALLAWLRALQHHFPTRFEDLLGTEGTTTVSRLQKVAGDENRYLKLRRIAVENLSALF